MNTINPDKRKIAIIAGSRGEYGYYRPIIKEIEKRENLDYGLIVTNMHVLDSFGSSINEIKNDGIKIFSEIHNTFDGYNHITMAKSLAVFMLQLPEILHQMGANMLLLAGDRGEQMVSAMVGAHMYLPTAHIQAGEVSGNIDGMTRHAITKYAHIHFCANEDAAKRVLRMGEEEHRIYNVGAPMLDELVGGYITPKDEIYKKFSLNPNESLILFVMHSVTEEFESAGKQVKEALDAVSEFGYQTIVVLNNSDAGSRNLRQVIMENKKPFMQIVPNMKRQDYAGLMNVAAVLVGNSSSGILEAPTFKLPAVNIGNRQKGRLQSVNVINTGYEKEKVIEGIRKALSYEFKEIVENCVNPYGDGKASAKIVDVLERVSIDDALLVKKITY